MLDVIEVEIRAPHLIRILAHDKDEKNAEAVVKMAVYRRGAGPHFFKTAPAGKYKDGDVLVYDGT